MSTSPPTLIIGCGHVGSVIARKLLDSGDKLFGIVKSAASFDALRLEGIPCYRCDLTDSQDLQQLETEQAEVYYLAPPVSDEFDDQALDQFLLHCARGAPKRIVYISTSGVYGNCAGAWVTETQPVNPETTRAKRRAYAEQALQTFSRQHNIAYNILRVGGIYGPTKLPIQRIKSTTLICPKEAPFSNRIHVDDLAMICILAMQSEHSNEVYNVADGNPTSMTDYFYQIADRSKQERPPCVPLKDAEKHLSPGMLSFIRESRRLDISKLQKQLNVQLRYPTLELGLNDCFAKRAPKEC